MQHTLFVLFFVVFVSLGGSSFAGASHSSTPAQAVAKIKKEEVPPFEAKVKALVGPGVKVTVKYDYEAPEKGDSYPIKDSAAYLRRGAPNQMVTKTLLNYVTDALKSVMVDDAGKRAVTENVKEIVIYTVVSDARLSFADGVLSVGNHLYGDGEGSVNSANDIAKMLEWTLLVDEPHLGSKVRLGHARAINEIETEELPPFRERVKSVCKCSPKITVRYEPQTKDVESLADPGRFLQRATMLGHRNMTLHMLDPLVDGLTKAADDPAGAKVLSEQLKEIVIFALVSDAKVSFSGGVLTVGNYLLSDGYGSMYVGKDFKKALLGTP